MVLRGTNLNFCFVFACCFLNLNLHLSHIIASASCRSVLSQVLLAHYHRSTPRNTGGAKGLTWRIDNLDPLEPSSTVPSVVEERVTGVSELVDSGLRSGVDAAGPL